MSPCGPARHSMRCSEMSGIRGKRKSLPLTRNEVMNPLESARCIAAVRRPRDLLLTQHGCPPLIKVDIDADYDDRDV